MPESPPEIPMRFDLTADQRLLQSAIAEFLGKTNSVIATRALREWIVSGMSRFG
jgi:hypothetical protein